MTVDRRSALGVIAALTAAPGAVQAKDGPAVRFVHGVASGDPLADRVILWTRATPIVPGPLSVSWMLAEAATPHTPVAHGAVRTGPERDYTVKADAAGLKPGRDYVFRFTAAGATSPQGRTRTLPQGALDKATLVFVTCSLYPNGYFNAYDHIARLDAVDAVIHLGDYIYEYGAGERDYGMANGRKLGRIPDPPHEIVSLDDYRRRHRLYKSDADLQAAHARAPWICVWDDHEVANDGWVGGAENHQPASEGDWTARKAAALQAYYEWMPIREPAPGRAFEAVNRSFQWGDLATVVMLESRLVARSHQLDYDRAGDVPMAVYDSANPATRRKVTGPVADAAIAAAAKGQAPPAPLTIGPDPEALQALLDQPDRQMLGRGQERWLAQELAASVKAGRPWQVLGNQVVMARTRGPDVRKALGAEGLQKALAGVPAAQRAGMAAMADLFSFEVPYDLDGWDGYPAARERAYQAIAAAQGNTIILSGDSHAFWANALHDADGRYVAAEFGTTSVTSPGMDDGVPGIGFGKLFMDRNPEVLFCDQAAKGYIRLTLTRTEAIADLVSVQIDAKPYASGVLTRFRVAPASGVGPGPIEPA